MSALRTICSLTVLPSSSMVLIFCHVLVRPVAGRGAARGRCTHKVDADGRDVALGVCVVCETEQQAGLSDTRVTDEEKLEEVVVSVVRRAVSGSHPWRGRQQQDCSRDKKYSAGIQVSMVLTPDLASPFPSLWRWASRGGYVPLRVHDGGVAGLRRR